MKKITFLIIIFLTALTVKAQNSCASASAISVAADDTTTVTTAPLSGNALGGNACVTSQSATAQNGVWYSYTAPQDLIVTITTEPVTTTADYIPILQILTGTCNSLQCGPSDWYASNGDQTNPNVYAEVEYFVEAGETIYIHFDDLYYQMGNGGNPGFTFSLTTSSNFPNAPGTASNPTPFNGAVDVALDTSDANNDNSPDMALNFSWDAPTTGGEAVEYRMYLGPAGATTLSSMNYLTSTAVFPSTSVRVSGLPYATELTWAIQPINITGGTTDENDIAIWSFTTEASVYPEAAVNPTPADSATDVVIIDTQDPSGNPTKAVNLSWTAASTGAPATAYKIYRGTDPEDLSLLATLSTTSAVLFDVQYSTTYYWQVVPENAEGEAMNTAIWSFTTQDEEDEGMSVDNIRQLGFTYYLSNNQLHIEANSYLESVQLYSILGRQVASQKLSNNKGSINISHLQPGVYLAQVVTEEKTKNFKFVKK